MDRERDSLARLLECSAWCLFLVFATAILAGWVVGGVLALCGAAAYAELGGLWPRVGGEYVYLRQTYRPVVGFLAGWVSLIAGFAAPVASAALAFDRYVGTLIDVPAKVPAILVIAGTAMLHMSSVSAGARVQTVFTALKALLILGLIGAGLTMGDGDWANFEDRGDGHELKGVVSTLDAPTDTKGALIDPAEISESVLESIIEADEAVMEKYFEGQMPSKEELARLTVEAVRQGTLTPIVCVSTKMGIGLDELLAVLLQAALPPSAVPRIAKKDGDEVTLRADSAAPLAAQVFKTQLELMESPTCGYVTPDMYKGLKLDV